MPETNLVKYDITDAAIAEMENIYLSLFITDLDDKEQFDAVHSARMTVKGKRVGVEKRRKELKADALAYGKEVDGKAKKIFEKLEPIESHLDAEERKVTDEQKRIKDEADRKEKEKIDKRIAEFAEFNVHLPFFDVAAMTDGYFDSRLIIAKADFEAEQKRLAEEEAARKAESERLEKVREEQEAEAERLTEVRRKIDEQERKSREEMEAANRIEREAIETERREVESYKQAIEAEKRKEQERRDREVFELRVKADAAIAAVKAEKDRQEKEAWEAKEKADKEAAEKVRQEALKPDKEKLAVFADKLMKAKNDLMPDLVYGSPAYPILDECEHQIEKAIKTLTKKAKEL